jgi:acyl-CoA synthetase (AMP-forming)/AMP-acid ligase II
MAIHAGGAPLNIANGVREFAIASPNTIAIIDGYRTLTYSALHERASRLASGLLNAGLTPGDAVAVLLGNRLEYPEIAAGLAMAGLVMVPLNPRQVASEIAYVLGHSSARALILDEALVRNLPEIGLPTLIYTLDGSSAGPEYEDFLAKSRASDPKIYVPENDPFCIAYTSGTTGQPKGVLISHRSRTLTIYATALDWGLGPGRRTVAVAPMYHGAGFAFAYAGVFTGGSVVMQRKFDPDETLQMVQDQKIESMFLVPTHAQMMRSLGDDAITRRDLSSLTTLYFNAAALPVELKKWVLALFPQTGVHELYGSTEASIVTSLRPGDALRKAGSVGHPWFMTEVRVVREDGSPTEPGEPGEIYSRSPFLMNGYLNDPVATAACTTEDGFLTCGDVVTVDDEGFISVIDRKKDLIITGGANVYPREIEEVLATHEAVAECSIIGIPDKTWGERIVAVIVLRKGQEIDQASIESHLRGKVAGYKVPKEIQVIAELPRNAAGKILKRDLKDRYSA